MTDDIVGLSERLRDALVDDPNYGKCLRMSLSYEDVDEAATAIDALQARVKDYEEVLADKRRLAREIDIALHGEEGSAKQPSLCDLVEPTRKLRARVKELEAGVEEMTPKYVAYEYLESPAGREIAEDRVKELQREVEAFQRHEQTLRDNGIASHSEAVVRVVDAESRALRAEQERDELQQVFDSRWEADQRAIKAWQAAHPDRPNTWPDHADMVVWLLQERDEAVETLKALTYLSMGPASDIVKHAKAIAPSIHTLAVRARDLVRRLAGPEKEEK